MGFVPFKGLPPEQLAHIHVVQPELEKIEGITQVPWQLLAGIWFRESFSVAPPKTPGGPWQFDPPPTVGLIATWLSRYTNLNPMEREAIFQKGINDFYAGGVLAGCLLQLKVGGQLTPNASDDLVKNAIWAYNGRAYGCADNSPYVMNFFDKAHQEMHLVGSIPDGHGGRRRIDVMDLRPGAFVVYKQLKEIL
jgi:hypothetical protein